MVQTTEKSTGKMNSLGILIIADAVLIGLLVVLLTMVENQTIRIVGTILIVSALAGVVGMLATTLRRQWATLPV